MKYTISTTYDLVWQLKCSPNYKFTKDGICINCQRGTIVRKIKNGGSIGFVINGKFKSIKVLRNELEKITEIEYPF